MRKKVFLVSLMLVLLVGGLASVAMHSQAAPGGSAAGAQRLFGMGKEGKMGMPPGMDREPFYYLQFAIDIVNPDLQYSKTIQKIVITDGSNGTIVRYDGTPPGGEVSLAPHGAFETDFPRLGIPQDLSGFKIYTVDVYWQGRGEPLVGYIGQAFWRIEPDGSGGWKVVDLGLGFTTEMVNLSK